MVFDVPSGYSIVAVADWVSAAWEIALTKASINGANSLSLHAYNCNATVAHDAEITVSVLCMSGS